MSLPGLKPGTFEPLAYHRRPHGHPAGLFILTIHSSASIKDVKVPGSILLVSAILIDVSLDFSWPLQILV